MRQYSPGFQSLAWPPTLENEHNNARWMVRKGIGWVAEEENCAGQIQELLLDHRRLSDAVLCMECLRRRLQAGILNRLMDVVVREGEAAV